MKRITILFLSVGLAFALGCGDNDGDGAGGDGVDAGDVDGGDDPNATGTCGLVVGDSDFGLDVANGSCEYGPAQGCVANGGCCDHVAGIPTFFHGPDGTLRGFDITNVKGEASSDNCVADTLITFILDGDSSNPNLVTYTHIGMDDTVFYRNSPDGMDPPPTYANVTVTGHADVTAFPEIGTGSNSWYSYLSSGTSDSGTWTSEGPDEPHFYENISRGLLGDDGNTVDVLGRLYVNGDVEGYAFLKDVAITEGAMDAGTDHDAILPEWTRDTLDNAFLITNAPLSTEWVEGHAHGYVDGVGWLSENGVNWNPCCGDGGDVPPVLSDSFRGIPDGFGERSYGTSQMGHIDIGDNLWDRYASMEWMGDFNRTVTVDYANVMPRIQSMQVMNIFTDQPGFSWTSAEGAFEGTIGVFTIRIYVRDFSGGDGDGDAAPSARGEVPYNSIDWAVVTPDVGSGSFTMPRLSDEYLPLIQNRVLDAVPLHGSIHDVPHTGYIDILKQMPFDPDDFTGDGHILTGDVPAPEGEATARSTSIVNSEWD